MISNQIGAAFWLRLSGSCLSALRILAIAAPLAVPPAAALGQTIINVPPDPAPSNVGADTILNLSDGGELGYGFSALNGATVNVYGGMVGQYFTVSNSSTANISGGNFGSDIGVRNGSTVNVSGGSLGDRFRSYSGTSITLSGIDFAIDGVPLTGLASTGDTRGLNLTSGRLLSGTFADGTPFALGYGDSFANGTLTLIRSAEPAPGPAVINAPGDPVPLGVRAGQTLNVSDGGTVGDNFNAGSGSVVVISGGAVGSNFEALSAQVDISGGTVGAGFNAFEGSTVTITNGDFGDDFVAFHDSTVDISSGNFGSDFTATDTSTVNIGSGSFGSGFGAFHGSTVDISGASYGDRFEVGSAAAVRFSGADFSIDGVPLTGLDNVGDMTSVNVAEDQLLSGTFADGTPFAFSGLDGFYGDEISQGTLTLIRAAEPAPGPAIVNVPSDPVPWGVAQAKR